MFCAVRIDCERRHFVWVLFILVCCGQVICGSALLLVSNSVLKLENTPDTDFAGYPATKKTVTVQYVDRFRYAVPIFQ